MVDLEDIDEQRKMLFFVHARPKKITGSRIASIVGMNKHSSEFKVACEIAGLYKEPSTKQTEAGDAIEPIIREYIRANSSRFLSDSFSGRITVEEPQDKNECGYEHFPDAAPFGGMVDGWIDTDGKHAAVLEIKTTGNRSDWFDENCGETVPPNYVLQTSLYCDLSGLDRIVFVVGFLKEEDYDNPKEWVPTDENTAVRIVKPVPMKEYKEKALEWYDRYIRKGVTPKWTDDDLYVVESIAKARGFL